MTLTLYGGDQLTPLASHDAATALQEGYGALARVTPPIEYPMARAGLKTARILCDQPNLLCLAPFGLAYAGGLVDTGRMAAGRLHDALALRRTKEDLDTLLADLSGAGRLIELTLNPGRRVVSILYFPVAHDRLQNAETIALIVRFNETAPTGSPVVARLWLREEGPPAAQACGPACGRRR